MKQRCMVVLVDNNAGVLARISSLFVQRGFNIESLTVSPTENEKLSRLTIMTSGDEKTFQQIIKQTGKLVETRLIFLVEPSFSMVRELMLAKYKVTADESAGLSELIASYGGKVADASDGCLVAQLSDTPQVLDDFLSAARGFKLIELGRTGVIAMERGNVSYEL
ncbi:MAG: acetolactate synthase small subunit [Ruminococcaceae bacterium]|nr:acetolactate synthase small subunit [Oscillospiraceae bacterium]